CLTLPELGKMLFGVESIFTKNAYALLNSTFFAAMLGLAYLCVDPILKTIYALRCFYGESLQSGEDLKAELKPFMTGSLKTAVVIGIFCTIAVANRAPAESTNWPSTTAVKQTIPAPDFDQVINQTIHESKYVWRMPREQTVTDSKDGVLTQFFE